MHEHDHDADEDFVGDYAKLAEYEHEKALALEQTGGDQPGRHRRDLDAAFNARRGATWTMVDLRAEIDRFETMLRAAGKAHATIATYVVNSERFLNWLEGQYTPRSRQLGAPYGWRVGDHTRSKYDPLRAYLEQRPDNAVRMTFRQVEDVLGTKLPGSARRYAFWWANDRTGNHAQAAAWMRAGRRVAKIDLVDYTVMFVRSARNLAGASTIRGGA
ncbi:MAG: hypothetical protein QOJ00_628 [Actinomycetota bacterium]